MCPHQSSAVENGLFLWGNDMKINLSEIRIDGGTQSRVELNQDVVAEYAEAYKAGVRMPDVSLFFDGSVYWMGDGFHRYFGAVKAGKESIDAEAKKGTQRDAWLYSLGANSDHGLQRTSADKRKAVTAALTDDELSGWSNREIAEQCAVSPATVDRLRHELASASKRQIDPVRTVERGGVKYQQNTAKIGATPPKAEPLASDEPPMVDEDDPEADEAIAREQEEIERGRAKLAAILLGDDPLSAMTKRCDELVTLNTVLNSRIAGLQREVQARMQDAKSWMRKAKALEKNAK